MKLVETPCLACGHDEHRALYVVPAEPPAPRGPWHLVECGSCHSIYLRPRPADPRDLYQDVDYHVHRQPGAIASALLGAAASLEARRIARVAGRGRRVFEIGCGTGQVLSALARRGFEVAGIEVGASAARIAAERGLRVVRASYEDGVGVAGGYDVVFAAHVLEHVASPRAFLREARRLVRPDGVIVLKLPIAGSWDAELFGGQSGCFDVPYHLFVPTRPALVDLLTTAGLQLTQMRADWVPNDWIHGARRSIFEQFGLQFRFVRPSNPLLVAAFAPFSLASAAFGWSGRVRVELRKVDV